MICFYVKIERISNVLYHEMWWHLFANIQRLRARKRDVNIALERIAKMPTGNSEMGKIYYKIGGELKPMQIGDGITLEDCVEIVSDVDNALSNPKYFKGGEITFKMSRKEHKRMKKILQSVCPRYFTNNWRKMHHLPLIRRRGKRK